MRVERFVYGATIVLAMAVSPAALAGTTSVTASTSPEAVGGRTVVAAANADSPKLPPVTSIRRESDIRPYLHPSVPSDVAAAALRRAWSTDPEIRFFVGIN